MITLTHPPTSRPPTFSAPPASKTRQVCGFRQPSSAFHPKKRCPAQFQRFAAVRWQVIQVERVGVSLKLASALVEVVAELLQVRTSQNRSPLGKASLSASFRFYVDGCVCIKSLRRMMSPDVIRKGARAQKRAATQAQRCIRKKTATQKQAGTPKRVSARFGGKSFSVLRKGYIAPSTVDAQFASSAGIYFFGWPGPGHLEPRAWAGFPGQRPGPCMRVCILREPKRGRLGRRYRDLSKLVLRATFVGRPEKSR